MTDILFEVRDARLPVSSQHPYINDLWGNKPRLVILTKQDLACPEILDAWLPVLAKLPQAAAVAVSLKLNYGQKKILKLALTLVTEKQNSLQRKGFVPRPMRACVVGLPNVGKSSLINWLIRQRKTNVADIPGVTRSPLWVRVHPQLELLDTPGVLPSVAFNAETALKLSLCNILPASQYNLIDIAQAGLLMIASLNPMMLKHYGLNLQDCQPTLEDIAKAKFCLTRGGKPDTHRAAALFLNALRTGKLGRAVFDLPVK